MLSRRIALLFLLLLCAALAVPASAQSTPLTLGPAVPVSHLSIRIGNLTVELTNGKAAPLAGGDGTEGIFFSGQGAYAYRTSDPIESSLVLFEAKKTLRDAAKTPDGVTTIRGWFDHARIAGSGVELPKLAGDALPKLAGAGTDDPALAETFAKHRQHFALAQVAPPSQLVLRGKIDAPAAPVAYAELGGKEDSLYILDSLESHDESFTALQPQPSSLDLVAYEFRSSLFPVLLSDQPIAPSSDHPVAPSNGQPAGRQRGKFVQPLFLLAAVDYTLTAPGFDAQLVVNETIVPRGAAQRVFRFDLVSGFLDDRGTFHRLKIGRVSDPAGNDLPFSFDRGSVLVTMASPMPVNTPFVLRFDISGDFLTRLGGGNAWRLGTEAWFPQPGMNGQFYTLHSIVKVKKPWLAYAPGETVTRREEGDLNVVESTIKKPVQFAVAQAGAYTPYDVKFDDLTVHVATYNGANEAAAKQLATLAHEIIKFYEPFLGAFPFKELDLIEINDLGWGQSPPATIFMTREAFKPLLGEETRAYTKGVNQRFAHEIAHQYWGTVVKMGSDEEQWLTEAFAEYCSALLIKEMKGAPAYAVLLNTWRSDASEAGSVAPIPLANRVIEPWQPSMTTVHRVGLLYGKGPYVLAALHKQLGDEKFLNVLRTLQGRYAWRFMTTNDVESVAAHFDPDHDYHAFFQKYYWGTEMPSIK
jgi:hypothetical protein